MTGNEHPRLRRIDTPHPTRHVVAGGGGLPIAAYEFSRGSRRPVLFIHGYMQSHLCWLNQLSDPRLLEDRTLAALDLRGHGESGRALPEPSAPGAPPVHAPSHYADDVLAVIEALGLEEPVLVGWSYGGLVIGDVVRTHGTSRIGGAVFAGAACRLNPPAHEDTFIGPGFLDAGAMFSPELATCISGTHQFLDACFQEALDPSDFAFMLAYNMAVPPANRLALVARGPERFDEDVLPGFDRPALVVHGDSDTVVLPASGEAIAAAIPGAQHVVYENCAHTPFVEQPERFNRDLLEFLTSV